MKHTLSVLVENHPGVLSRVAGLFARRGFNIESLAVGTTTDPGVSCITIVADDRENVMEQLEKQLNKLIDVIKVKDFSPEEIIGLLGHLEICDTTDRVENFLELCRPYGLKSAVRTGAIATEKGSGSLSVGE